MRMGMGMGNATATATAVQEVRAPGRKARAAGDGGTASGAWLRATGDGPRVPVARYGVCLRATGHGDEPRATATRHGLRRRATRRGDRSPARPSGRRPQPVQFAADLRTQRVVAR